MSDGPPPLLAIILTGAIGVYMFSSGQPEGESTQAFAEASQTIATSSFGVLTFMAKAAGAMLLFAVLLGSVASAVGVYRVRKKWDATTHGRRKLVETVDAENTDRRCLNCYGEIDDGQKTIATENIALAGVKIRELERVETFECSACAQADWFDYAMRAGEHDSALLDPDVTTDDGDDSDDDSSHTEAKICPECDVDGFKGEHGLRVHMGQKHPEAMEKRRAEAEQ